MNLPDDSQISTWGCVFRHNSQAFDQLRNGDLQRDGPAFGNAKVYIRLKYHKYFFSSSTFSRIYKKEFSKHTMAESPTRLMQRSDSIQANHLPTAEELSAEDTTHIIPSNENHTIITDEPESTTAAHGRKFLLCYDNKDEAGIAWKWLETDVKKDDKVVIISVLPVTAVDAAFTADYGLGLGVGLGSGE